MIVLCVYVYVYMCVCVCMCVHVLYVRACVVCAGCRERNERDKVRGEGDSPLYVGIVTRH